MRTEPSPYVLVKRRWWHRRAAGPNTERWAREKMRFVHAGFWRDETEWGRAKIAQTRCQLVVRSAQRLCVLVESNRGKIPLHLIVAADQLRDALHDYHYDIRRRLERPLEPDQP